MTRPPRPPYTEETAILKIRAAEDAWNNQDPAKIAFAYSQESAWRNRAEFVTGRVEIEALLTRKWSKEHEYRLIKELWSYEGNRIAVRFVYEYRDEEESWFRAYGNENWAFDAEGLMEQRHASINERPISQGERKFHWPLGKRPDDHPSLSDLGL